MTSEGVGNAEDILHGTVFRLNLREVRKIHSCICVSTALWNVFTDWSTFFGDVLLFPDTSGAQEETIKVVAGRRDCRLPWR